MEQSEIRLHGFVRCMGQGALRVAMVAVVSFAAELHHNITHEAVKNFYWILDS